MTFRPDDLFVFYSDGITDRTNPQGELFGVERLKEAAARTSADSSARITLYSLLGEVQGWSAGAQAEDDMTLVVARDRGKSLQLLNLGPKAATLDDRLGSLVSHVGT